MNTENAKLWIAALRSGEYTQVSGTLQDETRYCCLGVACRVAEKEGVSVNLSQEGKVLGSTLYGEQSAVCAWLDIESSTEGAAMDKNDSGYQSFMQIADWLEGLL